MIKILFFSRILFFSFTEIFSLFTSSALLFSKSSPIDIVYLDCLALFEEWRLVLRRKRHTHVHVLRGRAFFLDHAQTRENARLRNRVCPFLRNTKPHSAILGLNILCLCPRLSPTFLQAVIFLFTVLFHSPLHLSNLWHCFFFMFRISPNPFIPQFSVHSRMHFATFEFHDSSLFLSVASALTTQSFYVC